MRLVLLLILAVGALPAQDANQHYEQGRVLAARGSLGEAMDEYRKSIALRPDHLPAHVGLARVLVLRRDFRGALASVDAALRIDANNLEAQLVRASVLVGMGKPGVARLFLLDALKQNPDSADVHFQLGVAALADRRFDEAEQSFRKVWQLEPQDVRGIQGVAETLLAREEPGRAVAVLEAESAKQPGRLDLQLAVGNAAARAKQYGLAIARYKLVVEKSEKPSADVWARMGDCYRLNGELDNGVQAYRKAREIAPQDPAVAAGLALMLDAAGLKKEAADEYRAALKLKPDNAAVLNNLAYLLADTGGDLREALELAQRARNLVPNVAEVTDTVGWIYLKSNMTDAAIDLFEGLVLRNSTNPTFRWHLGMARAQKGDKEGALRDLRRALTDHPAADEEKAIRALIEKLEGPARP